MTLKKIVDGVEVDCSPEEVTEFQEYQANAKTAAEIALISLRSIRNDLLAETDWWVMPDRTTTQAQLDYRQALRDITETYTSLDDVVWPTKPS